MTYQHEYDIQVIIKYFHLGNARIKIANYAASCSGDEGEVRVSYVLYSLAIIWLLIGDQCRGHCTSSRAVVNGRLGD